MSMSKIKKLASTMLILLTFASFHSCKGSVTTSATDSATNAPLDSMPIIKPITRDTAGIITTPPVNDNINIVPDSSH